MSDCVAQPLKKEGAGRLAAALERWSADSSLAELTAASVCLLVVDEDGGRVLHASPAATPFRSMIADADGLLRGSIGFPAQIRRLGALSERPRLVRLRFDNRGIAPPTPCRVAKVPLGDGVDAVLVALAGPPPAIRMPAAVPRPAAPAPEPPGPPPAETALASEPEAPLSARLVWRSDGAGAITHVSGGSAAAAAALRGRSWNDIVSSSSGGGGDLVAALRGARTFRAIGLTLPPNDGADAVDLELSGAPFGRTGAPGAGFGGFAVIKRRSPVKEAEATAEPAMPAEIEAEADPEPVPQAPEPDAARAPGPERPDEDDAVARLGAARITASWGQPGQFGSALGASARQDFGQEPSGREPDPPAPKPDSEADPTPAPSAATAQNLTFDEHAAFREIARALGARFADEPVVAPRVADVHPSQTVVLPPAGASPRSGTGQTVFAILEKLPAGVLVLRGGTILFANRRLLDLTGFADLTALQGASGLERLLAQPEAEHEAAAVAVARADGEPLRLHIERSGLDWEGEPAECLLARAASEPISEPVPDRSTEANPVDDRPEEPAQAALEHGVVRLDADGRVLSLDTKAAAILADDASAIVGQRLVGLLRPEGIAAIDASVSSRAEPDAGVPSEIVGRAGPIPLRARIARLLSIDESPHRETFQDLAPSKQGEEAAASSLREAKEAGRRKLAFFAETGQKVRAPINGILSVTDAMLDEQFGPLGSERYRDYLYDIHAAGGEALGLLDDLVDLAKVESGRLDMSFSDLRLNDLVAGCIAEMQPEAARQRIVVRTSLSPDLGTLNADKRSIRQAALNALAQAIRHSEPGGQVIVSTMIAEGGEVALRIRDTGAAMSTEEIDRTLEPFRQASMPGSSRLDGGGLGLTLTRALVEANRGRFRITSRTDEGTLVEMIFPPTQAMSA